MAPPPPSSPPVINIAVQCNADLTGTATVNFSDPDGNTSGVVTINYADGTTGTFNEPNSGSYTFNLTAAQAAGGWPVTAVVQDTGGSGSQTVTKNGVSCAPAGACDGATFTPGMIEPTVNFDVTTNVRFTGNPDATAALATNSYYIRVNRPDGTIFYNNTAVANAPPTSLVASPGGEVTGGVTGLGPTVTTGTYDLYWGFGAALNISCHTTFSVGSLPYFAVRGGDVGAGAIFNAGSCTLDQNAGISGWNYDNTGATHPGYYGAGVQTAAYALSTIKSFATGQNPLGNTTLLAGRTVTGATQSTLVKPHDFAFPNTGGQAVNDAGAYGGGLTTVPCPVDYSTVTTSANTSWTNNYATSATYKVTGNAIVTGNATVGIDPVTSSGAVINLLASGDVYISGNILYNDTAGAGKYPRFNVVAGGNIYVDSSVTKLHGMFVAENGNFITCATNTAGFVETTAYSACNQKLNVYGAVLAKSMHLDRSYGTLTDVTGPAEDFLYSPELWLGTPDCTAIPSDNECPAPTSPQYNSVTKLPPAL